MDRRARLQWVAWLVLAAALAGGLYARLAGFGERQLAEDEYYFAKGVGRIRQHGLPKFEDGGYYVQGLLPQYLTAASTEFLGETNTALRLPALLLGLLVPLLAYRYARQHLPAPFPLLLSAALLVSSWEIEFSRFARMYTAVQCATLAFLYRFDRSILGPDWKHRYRAHAWVLLAALCHLQGAILAPLLFWPAFDWRSRARFPDGRSLIQYASATAAIVALVGWIAASDFRRWGVVDPFPPGYAVPRVGILRTPEFLFWGPAAHPLASVVILCALAITFGVGLALVRRKAMTPPEVGILLLIVAGLLHQGLVALLIATAAILRLGIRHAFWELPRQRLLLAVAGGFFLLWMMAGFSLGPDWVQMTGAGSLKGALRRTFLSWPDFVVSIIRPWIADLPFLGVTALLSLAVLLRSRARSSFSEILSGPAGILVFAILAFGVFRYFRESTRYHFLFYPILLATLMAAAVQLAGLGRGLILFVAAFGASGDFSPSHIASAGQPSVAFRTAPFANREELWYPRPDYEGSASFLQKAADRAPSALFIVHHCPPVARQFRPQRYASYLSRSSLGFYEWSRKRGTRDVWEGRVLLSTWEELREISRSDSEVFLTRPLTVAAQIRPECVWPERLERATREFLSRDGRIEVVRVSLKQQSSQSPGPVRQARVMQSSRRGENSITGWRTGFGCL